MKSRILIGALMLTLMASLPACKKEEGPMEKAGKELDKTAHEMEKSVKEATHEVEDAVKDAAKEVEEAIEDKKDGD